MRKACQKLLEYWHVLRCGPHRTRALLDVRLRCDGSGNGLHSQQNRRANAQQGVSISRFFRTRDAIWDRLRLFQGLAAWAHYKELG